MLTAKKTDDMVLRRRYVRNFHLQCLPQQETDCLIIGSGIAGLSAAWSAGRQGARVALLAKRKLLDNNSYRAQGGIAAALGEGDSPDLHRQDTLLAGAGLCDDEAVTLLVREGVDRVRELVDIGVRFDRDGETFALGREGCHGQHRILHANGDATGAEITATLTGKILQQSNVQVLEEHCAVDLLVQDHVCYGALVQDVRSGELRVFWAVSVILATGGAGQLYGRTTNPPGATADGIALAYRAGAAVTDLEFIQFHPTALALPDVPCFLISEAVRGDGALLRNTRGERFMPRYHSMAELAPRDVVTRAVLQEMKDTGSPHVLLDITHLGEERISRRFPTIFATCRDFGLPIAQEPIPVAPAAHYAMGGIQVGLWGETNIEGLLACGEAACSAIHGANRLASNSLLEALVWGHRAAEKALTANKQRQHRDELQFVCVQKPVLPSTNFYQLRTELRHRMDQQAGPLREAGGLTEVMRWLQRFDYLWDYSIQDIDGLEFFNMLQAAGLITQSALLRTESRGGHYRTDYPQTQAAWQRHISLKQEERVP